MWNEKCVAVNTELKTWADLWIVLNHLWSSFNTWLRQTDKSTFSQMWKRFQTTTPGSQPSCAHFAAGRENAAYNCSHSLFWKVCSSSEPQVCECSRWTLGPGLERIKPRVKALLQSNVCKKARSLFNSDNSAATKRLQGGSWGKRVDNCGAQGRVIQMLERLYVVRFCTFYNTRFLCFKESRRIPGFILCESSDIECNVFFMV